RWPGGWSSLAGVSGSPDPIPAYASTAALRAPVVGGPPSRRSRHRSSAGDLPQRIRMASSASNCAAISRSVPVKSWPPIAYSTLPPSGLSFMASSGANAGGAAAAGAPCASAELIGHPLGQPDGLLAVNDHVDSAA